MFNGSLPAHLRWYWAVIGVAAVAGGGSFAAWSGDISVDGWALAGFTAVLAMAGMLFSVETAPKVKSAVGVPFLFAAALHFPPVVAMLVAIAATGLALTLRPFGSSLSRSASTACVGLAVVAASWVFHLIVPAEGSGWLVGSAVVLAGVTFILVNSGIVAIGAGLQTGGKTVARFASSQRRRWPVSTGMLLLGSAPGLAPTSEPWLFLLAAIVLLVFVGQYRQPSGAFDRSFDVHLMLIR